MTFFITISDEYSKQHNCKVKIITVKLLVQLGVVRWLARRDVPEEPSVVRWLARRDVPEESSVVRWLARRDVPEEPSVVRWLARRDVPEEPSVVRWLARRDVPEEPSVVRWLARRDVPEEPAEQTTQRVCPTQQSVAMSGFHITDVSQLQAQLSVRRVPR